MIRLLIISTRLTPEMAASPQRDTIMVSAMPTVTSSSCSTSSGTANTSSSFWLNSGSRPPVRLLFSLPCSSFVIRFSPPGTEHFSGTPPLPGACIFPVAADVSILTHHRLLVKRCRLYPTKISFPCLSPIARWFYKGFSVQFYNCCSVFMLVRQFAGNFP